MSRDYDAFVSHSSSDAATAQRVVEALESKGVRCWVAPRDVRAGYDFQAEIVDALESVRCLILLFSTAANESEHVHREVLIADNAKTPVYPVRIEDVLPSGAMKYQLANRQWLDYFADRARVIDTLVGRIAQRRSVAPAPASPDAPVLPPIQAPPVGPDSTSQVSDDGVRRWLPPALDPMYLLFQFRGRIGRRSYVFGSFVLVVLLALLAYGGIGAGVRAGFQSEAGSSQGVAALLWLGWISLVVFVGIFASYALVAKRLHDLGFSAWWALLQLIPILTYTIATIYNSAPGGAQSQPIAILTFVSGVLAFGVSMWLLLWPGRAATNKYGPAPSFSRSWRPFDALAQRTSARSEFDIPFLILSWDGRIGPRGMAMGLVFLAWLVSVIWFFGVVGTGNLAALNWFQGQQDALSQFHDIVAVIGLLITLLFSFVVLISILGKRLHDIGWSAWTQVLLLLLIAVGVAVVQMALGANDSAVTLAALAALMAGLFVALLMIPGSKEFNAFGPPPGFRIEVLRT